MEVCYWALLFMPLVILHHLLNVFVQLANKRGFTKKKKKKFETLPPWEGQIPVFICLRNRVAQLYPRAMGKTNRMALVQRDCLLLICVV
jgi:hypothetical protein